MMGILAFDRLYHTYIRYVLGVNTLLLFECDFFNNVFSTAFWCALRICVLVHLIIRDILLFFCCRYIFSVVRMICSFIVRADRIYAHEFFRITRSGPSKSKASDISNSSRFQTSPQHTNHRCVLLFVRSMRVLQQYS